MSRSRSRSPQRSAQWQRNVYRYRSPLVLTPDKTHHDVDNNYIYNWRGFQLDDAFKAQVSTCVQKMYSSALPFSQSFLQADLQTRISGKC